MLDKKNMLDRIKFVKIAKFYHLYRKTK